jgi:hypothetical protein
MGYSTKFGGLHGFGIIVSLGVVRVPVFALYVYIPSIIKVFVLELTVVFANPGIA